MDEHILVLGRSRNEGGYIVYVTLIGIQKLTEIISTSIQPLHPLQPIMDEHILVLGGSQDEVVHHIMRFVTQRTTVANSPVSPMYLSQIY